MWKLVEIKIKNIVSFRDAALKITQGVATLIFGKNEDNASQPCNGSGKSSLIEAISFALTGEQLRKVKSVEEIIHDSEDTAYVYMSLKNDYDDSTFTIERTISRNVSQSIECHKYNSLGEEIAIDKTIQATVSDYNKFILSEIGLSKDDIYNFFILCDNKYESFFDCSDKSKKEIINRFSNGVIIDESIARLQADLMPVELSLNVANNKLASVHGSISAIENELAQADAKQADAKQARETRLANLNSKIQQCRTDIELTEQKKAKGEARIEALRNIQVEVANMEDSDLSLLESYSQIKAICERNDLEKVGEYDMLLQECNDNLLNAQREMDRITALTQEAQAKVDVCESAHQSANNAYQSLKETHAELNDIDSQKKAVISKEISDIDKQLDDIWAKMKDAKSRQEELDMAINKCNAQLKGAIECPKCSHKFFVNSEESVDDVKNNLALYQQDIEISKKKLLDWSRQYNEIDKLADNKSDEIGEIDRQIKLRTNELEKCRVNVFEANRKMDEADIYLSELQRDLVLVRNRIDHINGKIDIMRSRLFGEITGIIEGRLMNGENFIKQQDSAISFYQSQLTQYRQSKHELIQSPEVDFASTLKASLKKYQSELLHAEKELASIQSEYNALKEQEAHFTLFKSHIARKKIDALSLVVNDFLEKIGSDIRLKLEGFSVTKTGKLRDKISVQVMRDGIDCGSYHKFSGGEKARLNLACILSLHTLTNSNCEDGKGLDFIIIDELLDKSDEVGMATYCDALNKLGQTALLITQGGVAEAYPHKLLIVKKQGISSIQN